MAGLDPGAETRDLADWLTRTDDAGQPVHAAQDIADFIPILLLISGGRDLPDDLAEIMGGFALSLGIGPQTPPAEMQKRLRAYVKSGAVSLNLFEDVMSFMARGAKAQRSALDSRVALARKFLGQPSAQVDDQAPPPGSVGGGPMLQHALGKKK